MIRVLIITHSLSLSLSGSKFNIETLGWLNDNRRQPQRVVESNGGGVRFVSETSRGKVYRSKCRRMIMRIQARLLQALKPWNWRSRRQSSTRKELVTSTAAKPWTHHLVSSILRSFPDSSSIPHFPSVGKRVFVTGHFKAEKPPWRISPTKKASPFSSWLCCKVAEYVWFCFSF